MTLFFWMGLGFDCYADYDKLLQDKKTTYEPCASDNSIYLNQPDAIEDFLEDRDIGITNWGTQTCYSKEKDSFLPDRIILETYNFILKSGKFMTLELSRGHKNSFSGLLSLLSPHKNQCFIQGRIQSSYLSVLRYAFNYADNQYTLFFNSEDLRYFIVFEQKMNFTISENNPQIENCILEEGVAFQL